MMLPMTSQRRLAAALRCALLVLLAALVALPAGAADVEALARKLAEAEDFRVRAQAALALGSSADAAAVKPLCGGLSDSSSAVRAAAAAGLGKLRKGGADCLKKRIKVEKVKSVKSTLRKALRKVRRKAPPADAPAGGSSDPGPTDGLRDDTKIYVALGPITDKTGRDGGGVEGLVRPALAAAVRKLDGWALAPADETDAEAKQRLEGRSGVKGFYLTTTISAPKYDGGKLTIKVELAIFTYPGKALKATLPVKLSQEGASGPDRAAEDDLLRDAAGRAVAKLAAQADKIE